MRYLVFVKVVKGELSPFDEAALEVALSLSEKSGGEVAVFTMSPDSAADRMKALTRLGIEHSVLICDKAFAGSDTAATSYILSLAAKKFICDDEYLILCGRQSMDGDTAQVGASLAARLKLPALTNVMKIPNISDGEIHTVTRMGEENAKLPALITVERIAKLRFPPMRARIHDIEYLDAKALCADVKKCGLNGSPTKVLRSFESERGRRFCKFLGRDEFFEKIREVMYLDIHDEHKSEENGAKLSEIYAVGEDVAEIASKLSDNVITLERLSADGFVELFSAKKPKVVLFPSDIWGRRIAPEVATRLETGLCADCTLLETDGEKLFMYRPAFGGNITAKIECRTLPQIATVRTVSQSADIIVSAGLGVKDELDRVKEFADSIGAQRGASRGLVDAGYAPYEWQVGITGRTVAPKLYIALGISGAVHHTSAIEGSKFIFAINPDKNAQIFDFCDYGFVGKF